MRRQDANIKPTYFTWGWNVGSYTHCPLLVLRPCPDAGWSSHWSLIVTRLGSFVITVWVCPLSCIITLQENSWFVFALHSAVIRWQMCNCSWSVCTLSVVLCTEWTDHTARIICHIAHVFFILWQSYEMKDASALSPAIVFSAKNVHLSTDTWLLCCCAASQTISLTHVWLHVKKSVLLIVITCVVTLLTFLPHKLRFVLSQHPVKTQQFMRP